MAHQNRQLSLDSFELIHVAEEAIEDSCGLSLQASVAAASLLTSLLVVPSSTVVTVELPLAPVCSKVLQSLTAATVNA